MDIKMFTCNSTGKDGKQSLYSFSLQENGGSTWIVFMRSSTGKIIPGALDLQLVPFLNDTLRISNMYIDDFSFRSKGIIEAVICKVSKTLNKKIVSSAKDAENQDFRFSDSDSFWRRAEENGWAEYYEADNRYKWQSLSLCD